jgi:O-antigen/teichoic acid export membrane protein
MIKFVKPVIEPAAAVIPPQAVLAKEASKNGLRARLDQLPGAGMLTGSALLLISMTVVNAGNYLFNLILGRWLGPVVFADLSLMVTILLMVTLITSTLQTTAAKFAAVYSATNDVTRLAGLRRWAGRWAWGLGLAFSLVIAVGSPFLQKFFHTQSFWPFVMLAVVMPPYLVMGIDRGLLQGQTRFGLLALSYQAEMWVRLVAALAFVAVGWAVNGAVAGLSLSLVASWLVARQVRRGLPAQARLDPAARKKVTFFMVPTGAALIGQIFINNSDILIVKHFFATQTAGEYAALALIGRVVFFATWSVVAVMFPLVAQKYQKGEAHRYLLGLSLGLVGVVSGGIIAATLIAPEFIVGVLFGEAYLAIAPLLWLYAIATMLYALSNVVINYRLSLDNSIGSYLAVIGGMAQVIGLWLFHASLLQVVMVQIYIMLILLLVLLTWDMWMYVTQKRSQRRGA